MSMKLLHQLSDVDCIWPARAPHYLTTAIVSVNINPIVLAPCRFLVTSNVRRGLIFPIL